VPNFPMILLAGNHRCLFLQDSTGEKSKVPVFTGFLGRKTTRADIHSCFVREAAGHFAEFFRWQAVDVDFLQDSLGGKLQVPSFLQDSLDMKLQVPIFTGFFGQEATGTRFYRILWAGNRRCRFYRILRAGNHTYRFFTGFFGPKLLVPIFAGFFGRETTGTDFYMIIWTGSYRF
jgi:hypothetical protein